MKKEVILLIVAFMGILAATIINAASSHGACTNSGWG
jgi:hypothetical protein